MMAEAIVTGDAGFIGSYLAKGLIRRGYHVTIPDDLGTGRVDNIEGLLAKRNVNFARGSVTNLTLLLGIFQNAQYIFHQATVASVPGSIENPQAAHDVRCG